MNTNFETVNKDVLEWFQNDYIKSDYTRIIMGVNVNYE